MLLRHSTACMLRLKLSMRMSPQLSMHACVPCQHVSLYVGRVHNSSQLACSCLSSLRLAFVRAPQLTCRLTCPAYASAQRARFVSRILPAETTCQLTAAALHAAAKALAQRLRLRLLAAAEEAGLGSGSGRPPLPFAVAYKARTAERQAAPPVPQAATAPSDPAPDAMSISATRGIERPKSLADTSAAPGLPKCENCGSQADKCRGAEPDLAAAGEGGAELLPALPVALIPSTKTSIVACRANGKGAAGSAGRPADVECASCLAGAARQADKESAVLSSMPPALHSEPGRTPYAAPDRNGNFSQHAAEVVGNGSGGAGGSSNGVGAHEQAPDRGVVLAALAAGFAAGTLGEPELRVDLKAPRVWPICCRGSLDARALLAPLLYASTALLASPAAWSQTPW